VRVPVTTTTFFASGESESSATTASLIERVISISAGSVD